MNYIQFVRNNSIMVIFAIMMTALSSFGQTFLLARYVPFIMEEFSLSNGLISTFYGVATIGSVTVAALQVEFFGKKSIGSVRSLFTSIMVLSSAVGPALFGIILDAG